MQRARKESLVMMALLNRSFCVPEKIVSCLCGRWGEAVTSIFQLFTQLSSIQDVSEKTQPTFIQDFSGTDKI